MSEQRDSLDEKWADVGLIADAVNRFVEVQAYLLTGGSDGCALCRDRSTAERVGAGHVQCAEDGVTFNAAKNLAANIHQFELHIAIRRVLDDPRLFQWVARAEA